MSKIIIENRSTASDSEVLAMVDVVIRGGRVSNNGKQYCYVTTFTNGYSVHTLLNKKSDKFVVLDEKQLGLPL